MACTVAILATLDTKGEEARYVMESIAERGHRPLVIDCGVLGKPSFEPAISREEVAKAGETELEGVIGLGDESKSIEFMAKGAANLLSGLSDDRKIDGIIALGGTMGTALGLLAMKGLPLGLPKLMVSTIGFSPYITPDSISVDMIMMQSPVDMWGLDPITKRTLEYAAAAITAMAEVYQDQYKSARITEKPLVGITTLGTAACTYVSRIKPLLEKKDYEVAVFHVPEVDSLGSRALTKLVEQGLVAALLDLAQPDVLTQICHGVVFPKTRRIDAALEKGLPLVIAPGACHFFFWPGPASTIPKRYKNRPVHQHNPLVAGIKASDEEMVAMGRLIAQKANKARGPVAVVIPKRGFSEFDKPEAIFYHPEGDRLLAEGVKETVLSHVRVIEVDAHINDPSFSDEVLRVLDDMMESPTAFFSES